MGVGAWCLVDDPRFIFERIGFLPNGQRSSWWEATRNGRSGSTLPKSLGKPTLGVPFADGRSTAVPEIPLATAGADESTWVPVEAGPSDRELVEWSPVRQRPSTTHPAERLPADPLASVELRAPVMRVEEELAGLPWDEEEAGTDANLPADPLRLASVSSPPKSETRSDAWTEVLVLEAPLPSDDRSPTSDRLGGEPPTGTRQPAGQIESSKTPAAGQYVGDLADPRSPATERSPSERRGLGGGWPATPSLMADLQRLEVGKPEPTRRPTWHVTDDIGGQTARTDSDYRLAIRSGGSSRTGSPWAAWQASVVDQLQALQRLPSISSPESGELLDRLEELASRGLRDAERMGDRETQVQVLRTAHALNRRVVIWKATRRAMLSATDSSTFVGLSGTTGGDSSGWAKPGTVPSVSTSATGRSRAGIASRIERVAEDSGGQEDAAGWSAYLLLEELAAAVRQPDDKRLRLVSQRFLSRLEWVGLNDAQAEWLRRDSVASLADAVRPWAVGPVDYAALLGQLERQESDAIDLGSIDVARAMQSLRFASSTEAAQLAAVIDTHYRNANIRVAVSDQWLQRLVPEVDARVQPVRQRILGADVRGQSRIRSTVSVHLIPSPDSWRLNLESAGQVVSDTASRNGPVSIRSGSQAGFVSTTPIDIGPRSAVIDGTRVDVDSQTKVRGIDTDYDGVPLLRNLVREIAWNRYQSLAPIAKRIQHGQIEQGVVDEVDRQVRAQVDGAADKLSRHLVGPLGSLGLNPSVMDMQTTDSRLIARYRIGGDWQLAAFTPRPRAPVDSLLSVQIHQSALNNLFESVLPTNESQTIQNLTEGLADRFGLGPAPEGGLLDADELAGETMIQFAPTRPVTVEIDEDVVWVTLRIARLHRPGAIDLRRFVVRAAYLPEADGLTIRLVRDAHLRISGPGMSMRDRLPARAIFNKVFSPNRPLVLTPEAFLQSPAMTGLVVNQFELRDGWVALSLGDSPGSKVADPASEMATKPAPPSRFRWASWR